ncbi:MAG: hypothetical protein J0M26_17545 [Planctomycetes bacterium]|nr:hypothetical protein [Planctomycetota bacterium]
MELVRQALVHRKSLTTHAIGAFANCRRHLTLGRFVIAATQQYRSNASNSCAAFHMVPGTIYAQRTYDC